jgi:hypothetical protein
MTADIATTTHGPHCFVGGTLVCGWPDEHRAPRTARDVLADLTATTGLLARIRTTTPRCVCPAKAHGPNGCQLTALVHPEDADLPMPCERCAPFDSTGLHSDEFPRQATMTRDERESMEADRELMLSEYHGWTEGEARFDH